MREKIRTPGLLIRSQTLYPAELHAQSSDGYISTATTIHIIKHVSPIVNTNYLEFIKKSCIPNTSRSGSFSIPAELLSSWAESLYKLSVLLFSCAS